MVNRTRELENSLGTGVKKIEDNEKETMVLQRRSIRLKTDMPKGAMLTRECLTVLRPCPEDALQPYEIEKILGRQLRWAKRSGEHIRWMDVE